VTVFPGVPFCKVSGQLFVTLQRNNVLQQGGTKSPDEPGFTLRSNMTGKRARREGRAVAFSF